MAIIGRKKDITKAPDSSRQAMLWMHPEALIRFMTSMKWVINEGQLPADAKCHSVFFDQTRQVFGVIVTSNEFRSLKMGEKLPELPPVTFRWWNSADGIEPEAPVEKKDV